MSAGSSRKRSIHGSCSCGLDVRQHRLKRDGRICSRPGRLPLGVGSNRSREPRTLERVQIDRCERHH
jgi:hypothetical protein